MQEHTEISHTNALQPGVSEESGGGLWWPSQPPPLLDDPDEGGPFDQMQYFYSARDTFG